MNPQVSPLKSAAEIIECAREIGWSGAMKIGVAAADDKDVLEAVIEAKHEKIVEPVLVGVAEKINALADELSLNLEGVEIINIQGEAEAAEKTAELAHENEIQLVMKGFLQTSTLLKAILSSKYNLKMQPVLSHSAVMTIPGYHKLLNVTDGGMILEPTLEQKIVIIKNAILTARALGIARPKIALHSGTDTVNLSIKSSMDNAIIAKMAQRGQLGEVDVDGPLTLDCALRPGIAEYAGIQSPVAGDADALVVSSIEEGNIIGKALVNFGEAVFSGVVVGSRVPVSLVSRTDSAYNKKSSIAIAVVLAEYIRKNMV